LAAFSPFTLAYQLGTAYCYCELLNQDYVVALRDPELDLYEADGVHPCVLGSYAISLAFCTMIFNADPTAVTYHRDGLNTADEQLLREIVQEVVFDRISEWQ
jgi:hypothetical protein